MVKHVFVVLSTLAVAISFGVPLRAESNKDAIKEALTAKYGITKVSWDKVRVTEPGPVYVIKAEGINADRATDMTMLVNQVVNGQVQQPKGAGASLFSKATTKQFKPGDRAYLTKIDVKDDGVLFWLIATETSELTEHGSTKQMRYRAVLHFSFPSEVMQAADVASMQKIVDPIFQLESEAKAANTKTVELGQSPDQVKQILGPPEKIISLGPKTIYVYKDMKIVFTDNKVADVQ